MKRRSFMLGLAGTAGAITMPHVRRAGAQDPITFRFAHFAADDHPGNIAAIQFANNVKTRTNGAVQIQIFPNNKLGSPPETTEQTKLGIIDMSLPTEGQLEKYEKGFGVVMLPFVFRDLDHVHKVLDSEPMTTWFDDMAKRQNLVMLSHWEYGFRNMTNNKHPINVPDDVKGLKIRVPPEIQLGACVESLGGIVTQIAFPELYLALSQGVVDGEENPIAVIYFNKLYEVQKHLALTKHVYNNMIHIVSGKAWARLSPQQQAIFREESKSAGALMRSEIAKAEADQIQKLAGLGMAVTKPDLAPFKAKAQSAYTKISAHTGEDNVKKFLAILEKVG